MRMDVARVIGAGSLYLWAAMGAAPASAQITPPVIPLPKQCEGVDAVDATSSALPNVAEALRTRKRIVILAIGSTSATMSRPVRGGYYSIVRRTLETAYKPLKVEIVHRGVSGELATDAAWRIKNEVALTGADLVLWQLGTADALAQVSVEDFRDVVSAQVRWLRQRKIDVILVGLRYTQSMAQDPQYIALRKALSDVATAEKVLRLSRYDAERAIADVRQDRMEGHGPIEGNEANYVCTAEYLARMIAAGIFVRRNPPTPLRNVPAGVTPPPSVPPTPKL